MREYYEKRYHEKVHKNLLDKKSYYLFRAKLSKELYLKFLKGKILEFGCGLGQNIFLSRDRSIGIDVSEFSIKECEKIGIKVFKSIKDVKGKVDGILCVHVLEHIRNPNEVLSEFYNILKKNGTLVLVLPESAKNRPYKNFKPRVGKHLYGWNFNHINELLYANNFKILLNKFNYGYGYFLFHNYPFGKFLIKLLGKLMKRREMIIVCKTQ